MHSQAAQVADGRDLASQCGQVPVDQGERVAAAEDHLANRAVGCDFAVPPAANRPASGAPGSTGNAGENSNGNGRRRPQLLPSEPWIDTCATARDSGSHGRRPPDRRGIRRARSTRLPAGAPAAAADREGRSGACVPRIRAAQTGENRERHGRARHVTRRQIDQPAKLGRIAHGVLEGLLPGAMARRTGKRRRRDYFDRHVGTAHILTQKQGRSVLANR